MGERRERERGGRREGEVRERVVSGRLGGRGDQRYTHMV